MLTNPSGSCGSVDSIVRTNDLTHSNLTHSFQPIFSVYAWCYMGQYSPSVYRSHDALNNKLNNNKYI